MENEVKKLLEVVTIKQVTKQTEHEFAKFKITSPEKAAIVAHHFIGNEASEVMIAIMLSTKNNVIGVHRISVGTLNATVIHPREVFKSAILNNAASIILAHQHPSNDPTPSPEDIEVTERLVECGEILGIDVLDHLVVTEYVDMYVSLKNKGYI